MKSNKWSKQIIQDPPQNLISSQVEDLSSQLVHARRQQQAVTMISAHAGVVSGDLDTISQLITETVTDLLQMERASIWLFNESQDELHCFDLFLRSSRMHEAGIVLSQSTFRQEFEYIQKSQYIDASDAVRDPRTRGYAKDYLLPNGITSMLDIAIRRDGKTIGILCFEHVKRAYDWKSEDIAFGQQLADLISLTISNHERQAKTLALQKSERDLKKINEELEGRVKRRTAALVEMNQLLDQMGRIGQEITTFLDREAIFQTLFKHVQNHLDVTTFMVYFFNTEKNLLDMGFGIEVGKPFPHHQIYIDDPGFFAARCAREKRELFIEQVIGEQDTMGPILDTLDTLSMLYVPILRGDQLLGVITVQSMKEFAYGERERLVFRTLCAYAAIAFDNAQSYLTLQETKRKLELAQKEAEAASKQKSDFLAMMSHEMRTPLSGVLGMLSICLRDEDLKERTREQLEQAQLNAKSLLTIINDLLDLSKIEAGKLSLEKIDFSLAENIKSNLQFFQERATQKQIQFSLHLDPHLPLYVIGDPTRLNQVLLNLIGNAIKFTEHGFVETKIELVEQIDTQSLVRFTVRDSGIGIAPDALSRLFNKFEQADISTTRKFGGSGLGLAICRQLVDLMGGQIQVESALGLGSTFSFVLPFEKGEAPKIQLKELEAVHTHRLRVLCAEDFPTNQMIIRALVQDFGHEIDVVENGLEAVKAASQKDYDLILMDGRMPEMDGIMATQTIRKGGLPHFPVKNKDVFITALTANASEEDRKTYLSNGMNDFLPKPIDEKHLQRHLHKIIQLQLKKNIPLPLISKVTEDELDLIFGVAKGKTEDKTKASPEKDLQKRLMEAFVNDLPKRMKDLHQALKDRDSKTAGRIFHGLRGSAAVLRLNPELIQLCAELEEAADHEKWSLIESQTPVMKKLIQESGIQMMDPRSDK